MELFFPDNAPIVHAFHKIVYGFNDGNAGQSIVVDIMWGVDGINKTGVDFYNASQIGSAIWDKNFNPSSPQA